jgi:hypothetical protein
VTGEGKGTREPEASLASGRTLLEEEGEGTSRLVQLPDREGLASAG